MNECQPPSRSIGGGATLDALQHVRLFEDWDEGISRILSVIQPVSGMTFTLIRQLGDPSARARIKSADSLGQIGQAAAQAVPALLGLLSDENETVSAAAADALGNIGVADREVVMALLAITGDDGHPNYPAVHANASLAKMGAPAVPALIDAMDEGSPRIRTAACKTLAELGASARSELIKALDNERSAIREGAAEALGRMGAAAYESAESPVPRLIQLLAQGSTDAANTLGVLRAQTAVPALVDALTDHNYLCVSAALALGNIADPAAVEPLVGVLTDAEKFWVPRGAAAVALGDMRQVAEPALPALNEALEYDVDNSGEKWDERAREAVIDAISRIRDATAPSSLTGRGYRYEMWGR